MSEKSVVTYLEECLVTVSDLLNDLEQSLLHQTKKYMEQTTKIPAYSSKDIVTIQTVRFKLNENLEKNIKCINHHRWGLNNTQKSLNSQRLTPILNRYAQLSKWHNIKVDLQASILCNNNISLEFRNITSPLATLQATNPANLPIRMAFYSPSFSAIPIQPIIESSIAQYSKEITENLNLIKETIKNAQSNTNVQPPPSNVDSFGPITEDFRMDDDYIKDRYTKLQESNIIDSKFKAISDNIGQISNNLQKLIETEVAESIGKLTSSIQNLISQSNRKQSDFDENVTKTINDLTEIQAQINTLIFANGEPKIIDMLKEFQNQTVTVMENVIDSRNNDLVRILEHFSDEMTKDNENSKRLTEKVDELNDQTRQQIIAQQNINSENQQLNTQLQSQITKLVESEANNTEILEGIAASNVMSKNQQLNTQLLSQITKLIESEANNKEILKQIAGNNVINQIATASSNSPFRFNFRTPQLKRKSKNWPYSASPKRVKRLDHKEYDY